MNKLVAQIKSTKKLKFIYSHYATHGLTSMVYRFFGIRNRHLYKGYNPNNDPFVRVRHKFFFAGNSLPAWKHVHPDVFFSQNKKVYFISDVEFSPPILRKAIHLKSVLLLSPSQIKSSIFFVSYTFDSDALPELKKILENGGVLVPDIEPSKTPYRFVDKLCYNALANTWSKGERISHLNIAVHENICEALAITAGLNGDYLEIGVYKGGTLLTAINYLSQLSQVKNIPPRKVFGLDTFEGFSYEQAQQSNDKMWFGTHNLLGKSETISYIADTLANKVVDFKLDAVNICSDPIPQRIKLISVAYVDVDMYEATLASLKAVDPLLQKGGIIICEDPTSTPALYGAYLAMEQFLESTTGSRYTKIFKSGTYFLLKSLE